MIKPIQAFKEMPTKKKVAVVAGSVASTALLVTAFVKGAKSDKFIKEATETVKKTNFVKRIGLGFQVMGKEIVENFGKAKEGITKLFNKNKDKVADAAKEVAPEA